ncbi:hypothetical protein N0B31_12340 [Salinirubellus salinus]|uniref:HTH Mu-type domain-containing protein n=1 Tax=Salinirubellus salinus TaxID=1364945 RepID=A0A9E7U951_9EURY|nr:hypothetical protein [Salinirubellus salinus]UWM52938.1 hypothetical protein N0B31_12340 [Salinirubellus salinus]
MPSPTRRALLAAAGTAAFAGCTSLEGLTGRSTPAPAPFLTEPTDWAHPHHDAGNTGVSPGATAPDSLAVESAWTAPLEADEVDGGRTVVARTDETLLVHVEFNGFYDDRVEARDPTSGDVRWTYVDGEADEPVSFGRPVVAGDGVYLTAVTDQRGDGHPSGSLRTISLADGTERGRVPLDSPSFHGPIVAGGRCLVVTRDEERRLSLVART